MNILITGAPGAGKGTMSKLIKDEFHMDHVSSGDLFRKNIADDTPVGHLAKEYIDQGLLVPDEVTIKMVKEHLIEVSNSKGFLLDGFPRTLIQARAFEKIELDLGRPLDLVLNLLIDTQLLSQRITGRRVCPTCGAIYNVYNQPPKVAGKCDIDGSDLKQRSDDTQESLDIRLKQYNSLTQPMLDYYRERGIVKDINAGGEIEAVWRDIQKLLEGFDDSH